LIEHPNTVRMREVYENQKNINIIMDLIKGGELFEFIT
jgi:serine/threonine protein kinase